MDDIQPTSMVEGDSDRDAQGGMPRWVRVSLLVVLVLIVLFVVANVTGIGGEHGPGRHGGNSDPAPSSGDSGEHRPPTEHQP